MKKIISAVVGAGIFLATVGPAFAATNVTYTNTGPFSFQRTKINRTLNATVNNTNTATVNNNVIDVANSGLNPNVLNTGVSGATGGSGDAKSKVTVYNDVNNSGTAIAGCNCNGDVEVKMDYTGPFSTQKVKIDASETYTVVNNNDAKVTNNVVSVANSGGNFNVLNTKVDGGGTSGNATSKVDLHTYANTSMTYINVTPAP